MDCRRPLALAFLLLVSVPGWVCGGDWPQILGPERNGVATNERLLEAWPDGDLKSLWEHEVGEGYAGVAIADGRVFVFHRIGNEDVLEALELATGKTLWDQRRPSQYRGGINSDRGPRAVPLVTGDRVVTWSADGVLVCYATDNGRLIWERNLFRDFSGFENYFGAGSTPLVSDGVVMVNVGGRKGDSGIVGVDLQTGEDVWQTTDERTSYAAPILVDFEGEPLALFITRLKMTGLRPKTGAIVTQMPFGKTGATVNAATPLETPDGVLLSASYGIGAMMVKIQAGEPTVVWSQDDVLSSQYFTSVWKDGFLYGVDGREDVGDTNLKCIDSATGAVRWEEDRFPGAHPILVGEELLLVDIEGGLTVAKADSRRFEAVYRCRLLDSPGRALPALSDGKLLVRSNAVGGFGTLKCFQVGPATQTR